MSTWKEILRRAKYLGRRSQFDQELDDEIQFHIETRVDELQREGVTPAEALQKARREFGSRARMSEDTRSAWQIQWLEDLWRDLCYAARASAKSPGFTAIAVLSLAMGVGANCGMFIFVDGLLLRPLAVPQPDEVVTVHETALESGTSGASYREYLELRNRSKSFDGLLAFTPMTIGFATQAGSLPHTKDGQLVTANYFDVLGVQPALGRSFLPEEDRVPGRDAVVILSHDCWEREFASDPAVLGKQIWLGGIAFTIVGITPARFTTIDDDLTEDYPDYYVPMMMAPRIGSDPGILEKGDVRTLTMLGRLKRGIAVKQAQAEAATIAASLEQQYPETNKNRSMTVQTVLRYKTSGFSGAAGIMVMVLAAGVLLVACANVAGLLTSRAAGRAKEIAMRLAIGAGRTRLIRQLLTESLLLAVAGSVAGVGIGYIPVLVVGRMMRDFFPGDPSQWAVPFRLDGRVLLFSMAVALVSVVLFGLAPAFQATRTELSSTMKGSGVIPPRRRGLFRNRMWGRNLLVAGQVAISVLLLTVSSVTYVFVHAMLASISDPGFQADHVLAMTFDPIVAHYKDAQARQFYRQLMERLRSSAGVESVTLGSDAQETPVRPEGDPSPVARSNADNWSKAAPAAWVDENFFDALEIPILRGRGFHNSDSAGAPAVAVVNERLAKHYWPDQDPIGKRLRVGDESASGNARWVEIIGVATIKYYERFVSVPSPPLIFFPAAQNPKQPSMMLFARSTGDRTAFVNSLRKVIRDLDPNQAIPDVQPWGRKLEVFREGLRLITQVIGAMGAMGMVLALVGLFGLVAYDVSTRTREIGIRMALGAPRGSVLRMMLRQGLAPAVCGIGAGLLLNYGVERILMANFPANFSQPSGEGVSIDFGNGAVALLALAVLGLTMLAAYIPARRAAQVDPNVALRSE